MDDPTMAGEGDRSKIEPRSAGESDRGCGDGRSELFALFQSASGFGSFGRVVSCYLRTIAKGDKLE